MTTKEQNNTLNFYQIHSTTSLRKGMETRKNCVENLLVDTGA